MNEPIEFKARCSGANDDARHDIVMMDDFIYGEPELLVK
jgi:hypothetical protein